MLNTVIFILALLDIERIIRERDIPIVEKHLENILDYNIDSEELRILDPSFVKLFKLCQLSVEFLMYCKQYLDKTVVLLKSDFEKKTEVSIFIHNLLFDFYTLDIILLFLLNKLIIIYQENKLLQKEFGRITSENNKLKKKIKDLKMTLHYRHQLQQTLNDQITIYQCNECGKTFINNEYLNAHLKRRHNVSDYKIEDDLKDNVCQESPEHTLHTSPEHEIYKTEADRLQSEIKILKEKLNNAERYFHPDSHTSQNLSPNHGTVRIQNNSMYIECYNDIKGLQQQFELLKTMVQSELQLLKSQKLEQEKHDHWIQKVFDKLEPNKICDTTTNHNVASIDCRNSYTQTDETSDQIREDIKQQTQFDNISVEHQNSPVKVVASSKQRRPSIQKSDDRPSRFIKIVDSMTTTGNSNNMSDLQLVQEVEKKLEEKTKREIEQLGEQLTMKVTLKTFCFNYNLVWLRQLTALWQLKLINYFK